MQSKYLFDVRSVAVNAANSSGLAQLLLLQGIAGVKREKPVINKNHLGTCIKSEIVKIIQMIL